MGVVKGLTSPDWGMLRDSHQLVGFVKGLTSTGMGLLRGSHQLVGGC